jgi:hypothetical protein
MSDVMVLEFSSNFLSFPPLYFILCKQGYRGHWTLHTTSIAASATLIPDPGLTPLSKPLRLQLREATRRRLVLPPARSSLPLPPAASQPSDVCGNGGSPSDSVNSVLCGTKAS